MGREGREKETEKTNQGRGRKRQRREGREREKQGRGARGVAERKGETRIRIRKRRMIRRRTGRASRTSRTRRARRTAVERAPTCCLSLFTTSSGASTWPWNRHLRSVSKSSSITEINRGTGHLNRYGRH